jgi:hypothetical protein
MTTNCGLFYPNIDSKATLSSGSWEATMPLSNLQTRTISEVARTTDDANASTKFLATLDKSRPIAVVALVNHNLSTGSTYRVRLYDDAGLTMLAYDSGTLDVFPTFYDEDTDPGGWDGGNLFDLGLTEEERELYTATLVHLLTTVTSAQYMLVELFDTSNPDGYVQIGRLFMADGWTPTVNMQYGAALGYTSRDEIDEADSGAEYFNARPAPRYAQFELGFLSEAEAMGRAFDLQRIVGTTGEVLFVWNQEDTLHSLRRTFLARLRELSPIEQNYFDNFRTTHAVKELL